MTPTVDEESGLETTCQHYMRQNETSLRETMNISTDAHQRNETSLRETMNISTEAHQRNETSLRETMNISTEAHQQNETSLGETMNISTDAHQQNETSLRETMNISTDAHQQNETSLRETMNISTDAHQQNETSLRETMNISTDAHQQNETSLTLFETFFQIDDQIDILRKHLKLEAGHPKHRVVASANEYFRKKNSADPCGSGLALDSSGPNSAVLKKIKEAKGLLTDIELQLKEIEETEENLGPVDKKPAYELDLAKLDETVSFLNEIEAEDNVGLNEKPVDEDAVSKIKRDLLENHKACFCFGYTSPPLPSSGLFGSTSPPPTSSGLFGSTSPPPNSPDEVGGGGAEMSFSSRGYSPLSWEKEELSETTGNDDDDMEETLFEEMPKTNLTDSSLPPLLKSQSQTLHTEKQTKGIFRARTLFAASRQQTRSAKDVPDKEMQIELTGSQGFSQPLSSTRSLYSEHQISLASNSLQSAQTRSKRLNSSSVRFIKAPTRLFDSASTKDPSDRSASPPSAPLIKGSGPVPPPISNTDSVSCDSRPTPKSDTYYSSCYFTPSTQLLGSVPPPPGFIPPPPLPSRHFDSATLPLPSSVSYGYAPPPLPLRRSGCAFVPPPSSGLFGSVPPPPSSGLFGSVPPPLPSSGLFGSAPPPPPPSSELFGSAPQPLSSSMNFGFLSTEDTVSYCCSTSQLSEDFCESEEDSNFYNEIKMRVMSRDGPEVKSTSQPLFDFGIGSQITNVRCRSTKLNLNNLEKLLDSQKMVIINT
ncbi:hypothetical protein Btru_000398 [Bulinus truncatus]|nr:hypothetical protein Btru_000398 [Bulinus truncatus]